MIASIVAPAFVLYIVPLFPPRSIEVNRAMIARAQHEDQERSVVIRRRIRRGFSHIRTK